MMHTVRKLVRDIHRRSVWQVLGVYLAMSWVILKAVDALTGPAGLPEWTPEMALVLLVIGLPVVTATAFVQRGIPGLMIRDHVDPNELEGLTPEQVHVVPEAHNLHGAGVFTWRNAVLGGLGAGTLLVGSVVAYLAMWAMGLGPVGSLVAQGVLNEHDAIILADFENRTDDAALTAVVAEGLALDLGESQTVTLLGHDDVRQALASMGRDQAATLTASVARDVAMRENVKVVVEGQIARVGNGYLLTARLVLPQAGSSIASFREKVENREDLGAAIGRLSFRLREKMGESLRTIRRGSRP